MNRIPFTDTSAATNVNKSKEVLTVMKRVLMILLFVALLTGCTSNSTPPPTEAPTEVPTDTPPAPTEAPTQSIEQPPVRATYTGEVESVEGTSINLKETGSNTVSVVITTSDETVFVDIQTARAAELSEVSAGDVITAVTRPIQASSMPPQSPALAVFVNPSTDPMPPHYVIVTSIDMQANGMAVIETDAQVNWNVNADTLISTLRDGAAVALNEIRVGDKLVGWYQIETRSLPAIATPDRIVVLP